MNIATHAVVANAQDEATLRSLGLRNFDHVIVAIGEDIQASILVTLMAKEMGVPKITAKAQNEYHARVLEKIGADIVVHPERDMGIRLGHKLTSNNMLDFIELSENYSLAEVIVTHKKFYNRTIEEINFRQHFNLTIVAIRRGKNELIVSPPADQLILENDILLVVGKNDDVDYLDDKMIK
jgi:trk system potassium uptake protein TrkA